MLHPLVGRSPDLKKLRDEGYDVDVRDGCLLLRGVPYVNAGREIRSGALVSELTLAGDVTSRPSTHVLMFAGEYPCNKDGSPIEQLRHASETRDLGGGLVVNHSFSNKPAEGYKDYYEKMVRYVDIISHPARSIDPRVTACTFPVIESAEGESPFNYIDTASSRAGISKVTKKLEADRVAIVGLGGTGSYVLDLIAKTPVQEIHLFDSDTFSQHNAFRCPGAASQDDLRRRQLKVDYFRDLYSKMRKGLVSHACFIDSSNVEQLRDMRFVFLCIDDGEAKRTIVESLETWSVPFIDVGMGVNMVDDSLIGILRVTTSTNSKRDHVRSRVSFLNARDNDYVRNIQIADLNALNAALAVVKWKKLSGFYLDLDHEHNSLYTIDGNNIVNEDRQ